MGKTLPSDMPLYPAFGPPPPLGVKSKVSVQSVVTDRQLGTSVIDKDLEATRNPPSFSYGKETPGQWNAVSSDEPVAPGDILRFTYTFRVPFFESWQTDKFVTKLQKDERYELRHVALSEDEGRLWVEVRVVKPDFGISALLLCAAVAAIGIGIGFWLVTEGIEKLGSSVKATSPVGIGIILAAVAFVLYAFAKAKSA
jgi:hypothetical protein